MFCFLEKERVFCLILLKEVIEDYIEALRRTRTCTCVENVPVPQSSLPQTLRRE